MQGDHNRATGSHNLNAQSSRSHAIFSLWCRVTHMGASLPTFPLNSPERSLLCGQRIGLCGSVNHTGLDENILLDISSACG